MSRLIAFGCSMTYGHGLSDCFIPPTDPGPNPSNFAWPKIIADKLKIECINKSEPGASNKEIWHKIVNYNFMPDDLVFVHWSYPDRFAIFNDDNTVTKVASWDDNIRSKSYYKYLHTNTDCNTDFYLRADHIKHLLNNIDSYYFIPYQLLESITPLSWCNVRFEEIYIDELKNKYNSVALDNGHPGELAHKKFAENVMEILCLN